MTSEWSLALRNLLRNRRRSLSTLLALAIGLMAILMFSGFKTNIRYSLLTAYVRMGGHLQVQHRDFFLYGNGNPTAYGIRDYVRVIDAIRNDERLKALVNVATPILRLGGLANNAAANRSLTVLGTGYEPAEVNRMRTWNEFETLIVHPRFALEGADPRAAIVGVGVARMLQLCEPLRVTGCPKPAEPIAEPRSQTISKVENGGKSDNSTPVPGLMLPADIAVLSQLTVAPAEMAPLKTAARIDLLASSGRGAPNVAALDIVAAEDQGFKELDEISIILQLKYAQQLIFGRGEQSATAIMVQLHRTDDQAVAIQRIGEVLASLKHEQPLVVRGFEELTPYYVQSVQLFDMMFGFVFVLISGIVLFTVSNTMNAAVTERTVEIGTLRAVGMRQAGVRRLFVIEGFVLGVAGALIGVTLALVVAWIFNRSGMTWLPPSSSERLPLQLRIAGENFTIFGTMFGLIIVATLSAWWPAWRAARLNVVEALRHA